MNETSQHLEHQPKRSVLTAVILHEDAEPPRHAETVIQVLETMIREVADMAVKRWSFHHLERLDVRAMASHQSNDATVLIVCSSHGENLPESVTTWVERTYQSPHCLKPLIISLHHLEDAASEFTQKLASLWDVPRLTDFSYGESTCWEQLRDFVEHRLSLLEQESEDDIDTSEKSPCNPSTGRLADGPSPADQGIRDRAYQLWVLAGRPEGCATNFWHKAEQEITNSDDTSKTNKLTPKNQAHENNNPTTGRVSHLTLERLLKLPSHLVTGPRNALLQHLARVPQECITRYFGIRDMRVPFTFPKNA
jgi:hypothetical protein